MRKKLMSMLMALVMVLTMLPFQVFATGQDTPPDNGAADDGGADDGANDGGADDGADDGDADDGGADTGADDSSPPEGLLNSDSLSITHPTHLTSGETSITGVINSGSGLLSFEEGKAATTGSVRVRSWSVSSDGMLSFWLSSGKEGDTVTFPVTIHSENFAAETLEVVVTLGYTKLMITSDTTMTYGSAIKLTCEGLKGNGTVIYTVTNGTGSATVSGNTLTATKVGEVTVTATQLKDGTEAALPSDSVTITIKKATPTGAPIFTQLERTGQTLADAALMPGTFNVPGKVSWVLNDDTLVVANVGYEWVFTPDDSTNYNSITGTVTPYVMNDNDFAIGSGTTVLNRDGSYTTTSFGEDDSSYKLTEYPDGSMRMVHTKPDGTVTTTVLDTAGTRTQTIEMPDGSTQITATHTNGITHSTKENRYGYTTTQVSLPYSVTTSAAMNGSVIELPISELPNSDDLDDAPAVTLSLHTTSPVRVGIPINNPSAGTVAIIVANNGEETVVKSSTTGKDMLYVTLSGSATVKVVDNSKTFLDVDNRHWFKDAADFVTSRGLFQGMSATTFAPTETMSRAMLVTVLHNLEGKPYYGYYSRLSDVEGTWYETAAIWAIANGYISGFPDGTFQGDVNITREQFAAILYRYAGYPSVKYGSSSLADYSDYKSISSYAYNAMEWAVCSGVLYTSGRDDLAPEREVTRAEVAQTMKNLVEYLAG